MFTHEFREVCPNQTVWNCEEEDLHEHIIHYWMEWSSEATEHRHSEIEGIAGKGLVDEDWDEEASVEGSFDAVGTVEGGTRNISLGDLRELMLHDRSRHMGVFPDNT